MSATASIIGAGTTLGNSAVSGSPTYTVLAEVKDVKTPQIKVDTYEATNYTSPGLYKEWLYGWKDGGEVSVELNYLHATAATVLALVGTPQLWEITLPDTHTYTFTGAIVSYAGDIPNKGVCDLKLQIKVTGAPTFT